MAGIYFHIPFCKRICSYCDFYKSADTRPMEEVIAAMHNEMEQRSSYLDGEPIKTIYFGGGTPSLCSADKIKKLLCHADRIFDCSAAAETTLEANPDDLNEAYLDSLLEAGIDRLSIGIQSLDDACLQFMNRRHTAQQAIEAVRAAQSAGFANITIDLIFGIPQFGGEKLMRSLETALALNVQHISAYHLTIEPGTLLGRRMAQGRLQPIDEAVSEAEFLTIHATLTQAGFEHYEVSNYALDGFRARHNSSYWQGANYLGIGAAAHSFNGTQRSWNPSSIEQYIAGAAPQSETLTDGDRFNEYIMTRLRTAEGIDLEDIALLFGKQRVDWVEKVASQHLSAETLRKTDRGLAIPSERFLVSDRVIETFFEV